MFKVRIKAEYILLNVILLFTMLFFLILPIRNQGIRHIFVFGGTVVFYLVVAIQVLEKKLKIFEFIGLAVVVFLMLFGVVTTEYDRISTILYPMLGFLTLFILMTLRSNIRLDRREENFIFRIAFVMSLAMIVTAVTPAAYVFEDGRSTGALVLGMTNPNFTAMMLCCVYSIIVLWYRRDRHNYILLPLLVSLLVLIYMTEARSGLACAIITTVYALFLSQFRIPSIVVLIIILVPIITVPVYIHMYQSGMGDFDLGGKSFFSGREVTYIEIGRAHV